MEQKNEKNFKSGLITIVARPNVGKSTLLNKILGQKVAIATPLRQTTRKNLKGIYTDSNSQMVLIDTPGIHKPLNELGKYFLRAYIKNKITQLPEKDHVLYEEILSKEKYSKESSIKAV